MPELPEVETARRLIESVALGKAIRRIVALHPSMRRSLPARSAARAAGRTVVRVERRAKHQLLHLDDESILHVHFRMSGDWKVLEAGDAVPAHARAIIELHDGALIALIDPRALGSITHHRAGTLSLPPLGPEPLDPSFDANALRAGLAGRRGPIKPALLDQRVAGGIGNIYAVEALWIARVDPRASARMVSMRRLARLADALRDVMLAAIEAPARHVSMTGAAEPRFHVYDREGERCARCGGRIRRIVQAGRSTYFCGRCQR